MCKQTKKSLFTLFYQQLDVCLLPRSQGFSTCNGCLHREIQPRTFTPSQLSEHDTGWYGSPVLTLSTPNLKPSLSLFETGRKHSKEWSNSQNTGVLSALFGHKYKSQTDIYAIYLYTIYEEIFLFLHLVGFLTHLPAFLCIFFPAAPPVPESVSCAMYLLNDHS